MKARVPKPPKKIEVAEDTRRINRQKWKELFEAINPEIKALVNNDQGTAHGLYEAFRKTVGYLRGINSSDAEILILLPGLSERYLVGWSHDHMFSNLEIQADEAIQADNDMEDVAYEPETKPWKHWYQVICEHYNNIHHSVPEPPSEKAGM